MDFLGVVLVITAVAFLGYEVFKLVVDIKRRKKQDIDNKKDK